jgi:probable HAF family extracellular repeat protein
MIDLGLLPDALDSRAYGLNNQGQIVGSSYIRSQSAAHAFLWSEGTMTDLNDDLPAGSGWTLRNAVGVNDAGQIVGYGINPDNQTHAYLLTPEDGAAPHGQARLDPQAARGLVAPAALAPTVPERSLLDTKGPANPVPRVAVEAEADPMAPACMQTALPPTSARHHAIDATFATLSMEQALWWTGWEIEPGAGGLQ